MPSKRTFTGHQLRDYWCLLGVIDGKVNEPCAPDSVFSQWLFRRIGLSSTKLSHIIKPGPCSDWTLAENDAFDWGGLAFKPMNKQESDSTDVTP